MGWTSIANIKGATGAAGASGTAIQEVPSGSINDVNVTFTLTQTPLSAGEFRLYLDGIKLTVTTDFTRSGTTITMVTAPETGQTMEADYRY